MEKTPMYRMNTVIVGTGAAGFNAADELWNLGQKDIAIVTDHKTSGTSRNTGSDKQTYYKLTLSGEEPDSVGEMAGTLFSGQCVDGDIALCEAALSAQCFLKLAGLGVPFPRSRWGEYVGYKTDHDPRRRATSVGPYTSKWMTECLERSVEEKKIRIFDRMQVIRILSDRKKVYGLLCLDLSCEENSPSRFSLFYCENVVFATGGPAGMYSDSVYPLGQYGSSGLAFEAGVHGKNLTEWQYGLASIKPRWNVSGTYMQVLPRFISTDAQGGDEKEFFADFFADPYEMMSKVFLKGYQWPFDVRKARDGSSIIDLLVYLEQCKGRRVFLDYRSNPLGLSIAFHKLWDEAYGYLKQGGACFGTPIERLTHMNEPAVKFYEEKGIDLKNQMLEIALCAQHNNGGLSIDSWWQTNLEGFFAVGEVSASHGVYRPGGSALNAGQVGAARAARYIVLGKRAKSGDRAVFEKLAEEALKDARELAQKALDEKGGQERIPVQSFWKQAGERMSRIGAAIRSRDKIHEAIQEVRCEILQFEDSVKAQGSRDLWRVFRLRDILISQYVYLSSMENYMEQGGKSRGSALYTDFQGQKLRKGLPEELAFTEDDGTRGSLVQETSLENGEVICWWRNVRPIPADDDFFENVWRSYRKNQNVY